MDTLPDYLRKAIDEIDASVFSGDIFFDKEPRRIMQSYLDRWNRGLVAAARIDEESEEDEDEFEV